MKKKLLILLFVLTACNSFGQMYIGIKGGYTMSDVKFSPFQSTKKLFGEGYDMGLMFKYFDAEYVGFQAELHLTSRGYRSSINDTLGIMQKRVNQYIELPMFIQFRLNLSVAYLHINLGPYFAYLLKAKEGNNQTGKYELNDYNLHLLRDNRFDYGIAAGVGLSHDFKWGSLQVEGRYSYGLGDLFDVNYTDNPSQSPAMFQSVIVSYCYILGKK